MEKFFLFLRSGKIDPIRNDDKGEYPVEALFSGYPTWGMAQQNHPADPKSPDAPQTMDQFPASV